MEKANIKLFLPLIALLFLAFTVEGQENVERQEDTTELSGFEDGAESFPARPLDMWEIGVHGGVMYMSSDLISAWPGGFGAGLHVRKALGYSISLRADFMYAQAQGVENRAWGSSVSTNPVLSAWYGESGNSFVRNYKTEFYSGNLQIIANMGNILFHNSNPKWNIYGLAGVGALYFDAKYDALDGNGNPYDFSGIDFSDDDARDQVKDILDGDFETDAHVSTANLTFNEDNTLMMDIQAGIGITRKLSDRVNISLEHLFTFAFTDYMDGYTFRTNTDRSNNIDNLHYTNVRLNFNIGSFDKRVEPLYWVNPLTTPYNDIASLKRRPKLDLTDSDNDGVLDMFDEDNNTPEGVAVDVKGNALDSDNDGIPDYRDEEMFSRQGFEVNEEGVAQIDDPYLTKSEIEGLVDGKISEQKMNWWLPMIHFGLDEYKIEPKMVPALDQIAAVVKNNPNIKFAVKGYADNRADDEYNDVLSYKRSETAIEYLVDRYNLDRDRFIIQYGGEREPLIDGLPDKRNVDRDLEEQHFINRRVEFSVAGPEDKPMDKPDGPDAGPDYKGHKNIGY